MKSQGMTPDEEIAYRNFRLKAWALRRWRRNVRFIKYSRRARELALAKWQRAVQFWERRVLQFAMLGFRRTIETLRINEARSDAQYRFALLR